MFHITSTRYRFETPKEALEAAVWFEEHRTVYYDYEVRYSVGDTEGWTVDVREAGKADLLGNLAPTEVA